MDEHDLVKDALRLAAERLLARVKEWDPPDTMEAGRVISAIHAIHLIMNPSAKLARDVAIGYNT